MKKLGLLILLLASCKASRTVEKTNTTDEALATETRITTRASDTLFYTVPMINYRDTTITIITEDRTILKTKYNQAGQIEQIMCIPPEILEYLATVNKTKETQQTKETNFQMRTIDWFYISAIVAMFIFLFFKVPKIKL